MPTRKQIIDAIREVATAAETAGKIEIILPWETETIFTTDGLDKAFPPEPKKKNRYYRTGHNIVYDVYIKEEDREFVQISFLAMFTELSKEPGNIDRRNEILHICGRSPSEFNYVRINLMEKLPVTDDDDFLDKLKDKVKFFIETAIPAFEASI